MARRIGSLLVLVLASIVAACVQTSRVSGDFDPVELRRENKAVVVMKIGSADPACTRAAVLLGWQDGEHFKAGRLVTIDRINDLKGPPISELVVDPGAYHVLGYWCATDNNKSFGFTSKVDRADAVYRSSLASFTVASGEVLNVGYLQLDAGRVRRNLLSHSVPMTVSVSDWPLGDLQRFERHRPEIYAAMTTRLMRVTPSAPSVEEQRRQCEDLGRRKVAGKVEALPAVCEVPVARL